MGDKTHCDFSLQRPSPATAQRHQDPIQFSLQNLAKRKGSEAEIPKMLKKISIQLFFLGEAGRRNVSFGLSFLFSSALLGWLSNFFVISLPVTVVFRMYPWYFHFVLLWFVIPVYFYFSAKVGVFLGASFFRLFCSRPSVFLVCCWR